MVYLDNAATAPLRPEVLEALEKALREENGNPSSVHRIGLRAEAALRRARETVARALGAEPDEIVFTSGGTESNNMAIKGMARHRQGRGRHIVVSEVEHSSVLEAVRALERDGFEATYVPVRHDGRVAWETVRDAVRDDTILVTVQVVNNETGALHPVAELGRWLQTLERPPRFHVDAVQALGRVPLSLAQWGVDAASFSAHKVGGPKGVGVLWLRRGVELEPLLHGGGQERGLRSGTENVPGIVAASVAIDMAVAELPQTAPRLRALSARFVERVREVFPELVVLGPDEEGRAPHILALSVPGLRGEVLLHALEERGVYVSTGAACSSRKKGSHVLNAMGLEPRVAEGMIRLSWGLQPREEDADTAAEAFVDAVRELREFLAV